MPLRLATRASLTGVSLTGGAYLMSLLALWPVRRTRSSAWQSQSPNLGGLVCATSSPSGLRPLIAVAVSCAACCTDWPKSSVRGASQSCCSGSWRTTTTHSTRTTPWVLSQPVSANLYAASGALSGGCAYQFDSLLRTVTLLHNPLRCRIPPTSKSVAQEIPWPRGYDQH